MPPQRRSARVLAWGRDRPDDLEYKGYMTPAPNNQGCFILGTPGTTSQESAVEGRSRRLAAVPRTRPERAGQRGPLGQPACVRTAVGFLEQPCPIVMPQKV